jgi:hypothetical protein
VQAKSAALSMQCTTCTTCTTCPVRAHKGKEAWLCAAPRRHAKPYTLGNAFLDVQDVQVVQRPGFVRPDPPQHCAKGELP